MKILALVALTGCVTVPCLSRPPPRVTDGADECLAIPADDVAARVACGLDHVQAYLDKSRTWQDEAWAKCGGTP